MAAPAPGETPLSEADLKAGLVFNFARYVEWPASEFADPDAPLLLCQIGREKLGGALGALDGRHLQGRPVKVRLAAAPEELQACHLVFFSDPDPHQWLPVLRALAGRAVLTVSDADGFIDAGGAIGIVAGEGRLQFEVNRDALDRARLRASSQMLKLARAVIGRRG